MNLSLSERIRKFLRLAAPLALCGICAALPAQDEFQPKKVRVGFFEFDGYHHIAKDGSKSGYGYDFLQMIAPYARFEYEYVGYDKSWAQMQQMLVDGEIDLLTSAQKTPAREELFDYSDRCIGFSATLLTTLPTNTRMSSTDYSSFEGVRIGMIRNNSRNASFDRFARKHGFGYEAVYFEDQILMAEAMREGRVDAMVTSDLRTLENEVVVAKFDDSPFYAIVRKGNAEILDRVNFAIEMLSSDSPSWVHNLFYKYYNNGYNGNKVVLLPAEKKFLESLSARGERLKVLVNPDRAPYSYFEGGRACGIFADLLEKAASEVGFDYEIVSCETVKEYENGIRGGAASVVFGCVMDNFTAEEMGYHMTNSFHVTALSCVTRVNEAKVQNRVAVNEGMSILNRRYNKLYGGREQVRCKTIRECMEAVRKNKADCCYVYTYTASKYVFGDVSGSLAYAPVSNTLTNVGIAVRESDGPVLFHLMNRIAGNLNEDEIQMIIAKHTRFGFTENFITYMIYKKPLAFTLLVAGILAAVFAAIAAKRNREKKIALFLLKQDEEKREALELAYEAAERANKAKSDFLSKMSHDIRTPMNAIVGLTAIAQAHADEPERISDYLSKITASSRHLLGLINEVLDMSKIESGTFSLSHEEFNIQKLLEETVEIVMPEAKARRHSLSLSIGSIPHKRVAGDPLRIQQVFVNIAGNSIKYTPEGGRIEISARELEQRQPKIGLYEFVFRDNGIGMSEEFQKTVFDPFSREKDSRVDKIQGTGLGLAITKNIITMMDGTIDVQSEQNKGTTFTIVLKLLQQDVQDEGAEPDEGEEPLTLDEFKSFDFSDKKVLLVDDNDINREIAREILEMAKISVDEADDGKAAVEKFAASRLGEYSLVFMDVQMPVMNGYEASQAIRSMSRSDALSVPIVAMTADAFSEDIERASRSGMNGHIAKPIDMKKLALAVQKWLRE